MIDGTLLRLIAGGLGCAWTRWRFRQIGKQNAVSELLERCLVRHAQHCRDCAGIVSG